MKNLNEFIKEKEETFSLPVLLFENTFKNEKKVLFQHEKINILIYDGSYVDYYREYGYSIFQQIVISKIF